MIIIKKLSLVIFSTLVLVTLNIAQTPKNGGFTFPTNGPCTPITDMGGLCNDNGVMAVYGLDGILVHLPAVGPKGDTGDKGLPGNDGITPSIVIGSVTTGDPGTQADVKNVGTAPNVILDFIVPAGLSGRDGLPGKDAVFPVNIILSCQTNPTGGSIPKGFSASLCTITKAP